MESLHPLPEHFGEAGFGVGVFQGPAACVQAAVLPGHQDLSGCFSGTGDYYTVIRKMSEAWQGICKKVAGETQMIFLSLGRDRCREFVTSASFKSSDFGKATSLSETQLLALCERSESVAASAPARTGAQAQVPGKASAVQLITEKCMECHRTAQARRSPRGALQPFPDPITDEWVSANAARLKSGIHESATMKSIFQGQTYTPEERTTLETALGGALPSAQ